MPHNPQKVADSRKRLATIGTVIVTLGLVVAAVSLLLWGSKQSRRSETAMAPAAAEDECAGWNVGQIPTTRTITVASGWITESIPFCSGLDMDPIEGPILYRLRDGRVFKKTPDGRQLTLNGEPAPRVRAPGNSVELRSESGDSVQVIMTTQPKT